MTISTCPLSWSLFGVKRTSLIAAHMSASDPKRTCYGQTFSRRILKTRLVNMVEHEDGDDEIGYEN